MEGRYKSEERLRALSDHPNVFHSEHCPTIIDGELLPVEGTSVHEWDETTSPMWREHSLESPASIIPAEPVQIIPDVSGLEIQETRTNSISDTSRQINKPFVGRLSETSSQEVQ